MQKCMWASLPTRSTQTLTVWGLGGEPWRTKWGLGARANLAIRNTCPGHGYAWQTCPWTFIITGGSPPGHTGRLYVWCPSSLQHFDTTYPSHITMEHPPKADSHISMNAEVWELLSHAMLGTSSQVAEDSTPKRPTSVALGAPPSTRADDSSKLVATSS